MSDRLEEVKENHEHLDAGKMNPYMGEVILLSPEDYDYLIAEVKRLRDHYEAMRIINKDRKRVIESLTKEIERLRELGPINEAGYRILCEDVERLRSDSEVDEVLRKAGIENEKRLNEDVEFITKERDKWKGEHREIAENWERAVQRFDELEAENALLSIQLKSSDEVLFNAGVSMRTLQEKLAASEKARKDAEEKAERIMTAWGESRE